MPLAPTVLNVAVSDSAICEEQDVNLLNILLLKVVLLLRNHNVL